MATIIYRTSRLGPKGETGATGGTIASTMAAPLTLTSDSGDVDGVSLGVRTSHVNSGYPNTDRFWVGPLGNVMTQAWAVFSGLAKVISGKMYLIYPGALWTRHSFVVPNTINGGGGGNAMVRGDVISDGLLGQDANVTQGGYTVIDAAVANAGGSYVANDVLVSASGTAMNLSAQYLDRVSLSSPGYSVNQILTVSGGVGTPATVRVLTVDGDGVVLTAQWETQGSYSEYPPAGCATTGGGGTYCYLQVAWPQGGHTKIKVLTVKAGGVIDTYEVIQPGVYPKNPNGITGPSVPPVNPVAFSGGAGTGATFNLTLSQDAMSSHNLAFIDRVLNLVFRVTNDGRLYFGKDWTTQHFFLNKTWIKWVSRTVLETGARWKSAGLTSSADNHYKYRHEWPISRALPATLNYAIDLGSLTLSGDGFGGQGSGFVHIALAANGGTTNFTKEWRIPCSYHRTNGAWQIVDPVTDTGPTNGNDCDLHANLNNNMLSLRLMNKTSVAANVYLMVTHVGAESSAFVESSEGAVVTPPTVYYVTELGRAVEREKTLVVAVANGDSVDATGYSYVMLKPASTIAGCTVSLSAPSGSGHRISIMSTNPITALTVTTPGAAKSNSPAGLAAFDEISFIYDASAFNWRRPNKI